MGSIAVDQIRSDGSLAQGVDTTLSPTQKTNLLLSSLPESTSEVYGDQRVVRFGENVILAKQITHLGNPWPGFKKRIQIPKRWLDIQRNAVSDGLTPRFVGIYHNGDVTIFVDFDPSSYVRRKANNSAAHVWTNDLHQAQTHGLFSREDRNGNHLVSVRRDKFSDYLRGTVKERRSHIDVFKQFNAEFLTFNRTEALDAIQEMHAVAWPDAFQAEWPGFYLEFRLDNFLDRCQLMDTVMFQRMKVRGQYDYDLVFKDPGGTISYYGDLKASNIATHEAPGNDAENLRRCVREFGRFWYVIYEHDTWHSRRNANIATIAWNQWKQSVGHRTKKEYDELSYASRFKEAVRFVKMSILEVNEANIHIVLDEFHQGRQADGAARALKVMIKKNSIDNFLIFSEVSD